MTKKYYIEKKDLDLLPESYKSLAVIYASNYDLIQSKQKLVIDLNDRITQENIELSNLNNANNILYNQLKFIKKSYVPKVYLKVYKKKNNSQLYVHVIIKYFNVSKTVYLGKRDVIITKLSDKIKSFKINNFSKKLKSYLQPIVRLYCTRFTSQSSFINSKINSTILFTDFDSSVTNVDDKFSFSDYLRSLSASD